MPAPLARIALAPLALASLVALLPVTGAALAQAPAAPSAPQPTSEQRALEDAFLRHTMGAWWGGVLVARGDDVLFHRGAGVKHPDRLQPIDEHSLFDVGSVSKQFTAFAALLLVQDGKLLLDDPIETFLPQAIGSGITVRHLLTHRAGLDDTRAMSPLAEPSRDAMLTRAFGSRRAFEPGSRFAYSNLGYCVLAAVIDQASEVGFDEFVRTRVFQAAGLTSTGFTDGKGLDPAHATVRVIAGQEGAQTRDSFDDPWGWGARGCTGVLTTLRDLHTWTRVLRQRTLLSPELTDVLFAPSDQPAPRRGAPAMGWFIELGPGGRTRISHGGATRGYRAELSMLPDEGVVIAVLTSQTHDPAGLRDALERALYPDASPATAAHLFTRGLTFNQHKLALLENASLRFSPLAGASPSTTPAAPTQSGAPWAGALNVLNAADADAPRVLARLWLSRQSAADLRRQLDMIRAHQVGAQGVNRAAGSIVLLGTLPYARDGEGVISVSTRGVSIDIADRYAGSAGPRSIEDIRPTLFLRDDDNSFWPLILRMDPAASESLSDALQALATAP